TDLRIIAESTRIITGFAHTSLHPGAACFRLTGRVGGRETAAALNLFVQEIDRRHAAVSHRKPSRNSMSSPGNWLSPRPWPPNPTCALAKMILSRCGRSGVTAAGGALLRWNSFARTGGRRCLRWKSIQGGALW